jgi:hypothetical protein
MTEQHARTTDLIYPQHEFFYSFVPVATAARDWNVSSRRIRALLASRRLQGIRRTNGYWEVAYPYNFTFGRRGPALKRSQKPERSTASNQKTTLQESGKS